MCKRVFTSARWMDLDGNCTRMKLKRKKQKTATRQKYFNPYSHNQKNTSTTTLKIIQKKMKTFRHTYHTDEF